MTGEAVSMGIGFTLPSLEISRGTPKLMPPSLRRELTYTSATAIVVPT